MSKLDLLYTELFRPTSLNMLIAPDRIKSVLSKGLIQNLLLEGPAGTGKTSTAYIMAGGKNHPNVKFVNASTDGRQDIIDEIKDFCQTGTLFGDPNAKKVVIFDEVDGASTAFFNSMRGLIEEFVNTTRFIMTCNVLSKVPQAIQSRMDIIKFKPINKAEEDYVMGEYSKRISLILTELKISHTPNTIDEYILAPNFPDMRKIMNVIQNLKLSGVVDLNRSAIASVTNNVELYKLCLSPSPNSVETYKIVQSEYAQKVHECMLSLGSEFIDYIITNHPNKTVAIPNIIVTVADYQHKLQSVIDPTISLQALIFSIQNILNQVK
ncbi:MAG: AAA family ATPase [Bacteroidales bacterium]